MITRYNVLVHTTNYYVDSNSKILSLEVSIFSPDTTSGIKDNSMKLDQLYIYRQCIRFCVLFEDKIITLCMYYVLRENWNLFLNSFFFSDISSNFSSNVIKIAWKMPEIPGICDDFKFQCPLQFFHCKMGESPWFQRICSSIITQNMAGKFDAMRMVWLLKVWNIFLNADFKKK